MDNPVDNIVDLGLINYVRHPENPNYIVFRIQDKERAVSFETELSQAGIWFEKGEEEKRQRIYTLFGIHKSDFKKVEKLNFLVESRHKKPLIPFKPLRYFILVFGLGMLILASIGYCQQQGKLSAYNSINSSDAR